MFSGERLFFSGDSLSSLNKRIGLEYLFFKSTDIAEKATCKIEIAKSLEAESEFDAALKEIDTAIRVVSSSGLFLRELVYESHYQRAFCLFMMDSFTLADIAAKKLVEIFPDSIYSPRLALLSALVMNHLERFSDSKKHFMETLLHHHIDTVGIGNAYEKAASAKYKSVKKTKRLARFLPGTGFFYLHKPSEGVVSVAANVVFLGYTAYSIYTGYYITAAFTGLRNFMRFHSGGIKASALLAGQYNENKKQKVMSAIDEYCINAIK